MARCCDALFLLAMTEVAMTTMISSHVKDENCFFDGYQIFVTEKILVFHQCLYIKGNQYFSDSSFFYRLEQLSQTLLS